MFQYGFVLGTSFFIWIIFTLRINMQASTHILSFFGLDFISEAVDNIKTHSFESLRRERVTDVDVNVLVG